MDRDHLQMIVSFSLTHVFRIHSQSFQIIHKIWISHCAPRSSVHFQLQNSAILLYFCFVLFGLSNIYLICRCGWFLAVKTDFLN